MRLRVFAISVCLIMALAGCAKTPPKVTGVVTHNGERLKSGEVRFFGPDLTRSALINADGTYSATDCPVGEVKVAVISAQAATTPPPIIGKRPADVTLTAAVSAIPERYNDPETSQLVYTLKRGAQKIDIKLTD